jgi:pilus assembly protein CpaC
MHREQDHRRRVKRAALWIGTAALAGVTGLAPLAAIAANAGNPNRIEQPGGGDTTVRAVTVGLNKSVLIDLPAEVREVVISNPAVVEAVVRTARRVHLLGQQIGQATASFIAQDGRQMLTLDVSVERDLTPVSAIIHRLMPDADVHLEAMNDNIVVSGSVANPLDAARIADIAGRFVAKREQVLNMLTVEAKEQVLLRVSVVEMNRSVIRRLGIDVQEALTSGNVAAVKIAETAFPVTGGMIADAALNVADGTLRAPGAGTALAGAWGAGKSRIGAMIQALERSGLARTLAEPNLTSVSGETAKFLAGGEYPVPVGSDNNGTTIVFKPFGVSLSFTPVVLSEGRISLNIATEVSELTSEGAVMVKDVSVPALKVRRASSTLELASGASLVMAGLISSQTRRNVDGLPGLRNLPVLGTLFSSEDFVRSETELVVIVTPVLVRGRERTALSAPSDAGTPAAAANGDTLAAAGQSYGFIIE